MPTIKVEKAVLRAKLLSRRDELEMAYINACLAYEADVALKTKQAQAALKEALKDPSQIIFSYQGAMISMKDIKLESTRPSKPSECVAITKQITRLDMAMGDIISLSDKDNYLQYL